MAIWLRKATVDAPGNVGALADVIPARSFATLTQLDDGYRQLVADREALLAEARTRADQIVAAARARAAVLEEEARELHASAQRRGYEKGQESALVDWYDKAASVAQMQQLLHERMRERFAQLVMAAAEQVIGAESRTGLLARATIAVETIVDQATYLRVKVHPDDLGAAQAEFGRLAERRREVGSPLPLIVTAERGLAIGSCLCETDIGTADASLATQLRAMRAAVDRALNAAPDGEPAPSVEGEQPTAADKPHTRAADQAPVPDPSGHAVNPSDDEDDVEAWMRELDGEAPSADDVGALGQPHDTDEN